MISPATIRKVQDSADLLDVVSSFVKLRKRGANYLGNCPFHQEKTPSFTVSPSKGIYKCFGCGKAGNVITFVQEHEKLSYPETIHWLARRYHIEVEETEQSNEAREQQQLEESLRILNNYAAGYFHEVLMTDEEGKQIGWSYFKERGFRDETIQKFQLGYCPEDRHRFPEDALNKGYNRDLLIKAGLVYERQGKLGSMYAGRVIFPIQHQNGKIIGFGARILKNNEKAPKYINTPENEVYHKGKTLYGIFQARQEISREDECFLVEGYTDVISMHQSGITNVVASSGTALTEDQLKLIKRFTLNLTIIYDGDAAGIKAALRGLDMAIEQGLHVRVVLLPDTHDPDSFVREQGMHGFKKFVQDNKQDIILFKLEASLREAGQDSIRKSALINDIAETLSRINKVEEFTRQQDYIRRCAQLLQIEEAGLISLVNKKIREKVVKRDVSKREEAEQLEKQASPEQTIEQPPVSELLRRDYPQERGLVRILIEYGNKPFNESMTVAEYVRIKVTDAEFVHEVWNRLFHDYFAQFDTSLQYPALRSYTYHDDPVIREAAIEAIAFPYELSSGWEEKHQILTPSREMLYLQDVEQTVTYFLLRKIRGLQRDLFNEYEKISDQDQEEVHVLQMSISELKRNEAELMKPLQSVLTK